MTRVGARLACRRLPIAPTGPVFVVHFDNAFASPRFPLALSRVEEAKHRSWFDTLTTSGRNT
jgi:hypothetical protein